LKRGRGRGINKCGDGECAGPARPTASEHARCGGRGVRVREAPRGADCVGCLGGEVGDGWRRGSKSNQPRRRSGEKGRKKKRMRSRGGVEVVTERDEGGMTNEAERRTTRTRDAMLLG
jgi:hypothetical protein